MRALQKTIFFFLFCGIFAASPIFSQTVGEWKQADSKNFQIISDASVRETEEVAAKLEDFRRRFFSLFQQTESKSPVSSRILIFKSEADYADYFEFQTARRKDDLLKNSFQEGQDANYFVVISNGAETDFHRIYHQYFHYLLSNYVGKSKIPAWLNEGLAQVYENFQTRAPHKYEILNQTKFLPPEIFFNTDYYALNQQENHHAGVFYAQAAALVDYLMRHGDEKFSQFLNLLAAGKSLNESLIKSFQLDAPSIEKNLKAFIAEYPNDETFRGHNENSQKISLKFSPLSQAETEAYFGDFLFQANLLDEAELHSLKSISLNSSASFPKSTLGLIKLRRYNFEEAFQNLKKALESGDANYLTFYRNAFALSRQGMTEYGFVSNYEPETADKIHEFLEKSTELNPDFAENYNLFAFVSFVRNEKLDQSLSFIARALAAAPGNEQYLLRKAELDMRKENFTQARKNATKVYQSAANSGLRLYAQNTLQRIDSTEYQLLESRRREKYPYNDIISEKPFSDEEIARLRAKAMLDSLNAVLRRPAPDEKRILGNVTEINCTANQVDFTIKTGSQILKLRADSFETVNLMTFNAGLSKAQIGCGSQNKENSAVIIYRKSSDAKSEIYGEILSIEFVPKEFTLSVNN